MRFFGIFIPDLFEKIPWDWDFFRGMGNPTKKPPLVVIIQKTPKIGILKKILVIVIEILDFYGYEKLRFDELGVSTQILC